MMPGIVLHCPNIACKKLFAKEVCLMPGTEFKSKCFWCGHLIEVKSTGAKIYLKDLDDTGDNLGLISFV
jgi:hypothetical protein